MDELVESGHFVEDAADVEDKKLRLRQEQGRTTHFDTRSRFKCLICCAFLSGLCYHSYLVLPWLLCCYGYCAHTW